MKDQYLISFDDSSDEEDSTDNYNVIEKLPALKSQKVPGQYHKLSFIANALGVKLFYSKSVQTEYYKLKESFLSYKQEKLPIEENISKWLHDCFKKALVDNYFRLPKGNDHITDAISKDFLFKSNSRLNEIINQIISKKREFLKLLTKNKLEEGFSDSLSKFITLVQNYIDTESFSELLGSIILTPEKSWTLGNLRLIDELKERINGLNINELDQEIIKVPTTNGGKVSFSEKNKQIFSKEMTKEPQTPVKNTLKKMHAELTGSPSIAVFKQDVESKLQNEKIKELYENKVNSSVYSEVKDLLIAHGFIQLDTENTKEYLQDNFEDDKEVLIESFNSSRHKFAKDNIQHRMTLEDSKEFELPVTESFYDKFLATLRLCNRSIKRTLKDREDLDNEYSYLEEEGFSRSWKFPASKHAVIDIHRISTKEALRKDLTESLGGYKSIYQVIEQVKSCINNKISDSTKKINDADVAHWIKLIAHGSALKALPYFDINKGNLDLVQPRLQENILKDLVKITYVILGSEVTRNPASLIYNNMILDLITQENMSWKKALDHHTKLEIIKKVSKKDNKVTEKQKEIADGGEMPMSVKDAVMAARSLHNEYGESMPNQYTYDKHKYTPDSRMDELSSRGYRIMIEWLGMKFREQFKENYHEQEYFNTGTTLSLKDDRLQEAVELITNTAQNVWILGECQLDSEVSSVE